MPIWRHRQSQFLCHYPLVNTAPSPTWRASVCTLKDLVKSGVITGASVSACFKSLKDLWQSSVQTQVDSFFFSACKGAALSAK